jgi:hypothetical protein
MLFKIQKLIIESELKQQKLEKQVVKEELRARKLRVLKECYRDYVGDAVVPTVEGFQKFIQNPNIQPSVIDVFEEVKHGCY